MISLALLRKRKDVLGELVLRACMVVTCMQCPQAHEMSMLAKQEHVLTNPWGQNQRKASRPTCQNKAAGPRLAGTSCGPPHKVSNLANTAIA